MSFDRGGFAVMIAGFRTFLNVYTPQAILPALAKTFEAPLPRTGLTITAPLLAVAFVAPFVGTISDRLGRKWIIFPPRRFWWRRSCWWPTPRAWAK